MELHQLQAQTKRKKSRRIGRGGKRGTTSGRGTKGQKSRAGHRIRPAIRDLMMKIPKRRGSKFKSLKEPFIVVDLGIINRNFNPGEKVTPRTLIQRRMINFGKGVAPRVKVLAEGQINKKLIFEGLAVSRKAAEKILLQGGEVRQLDQ